MPKSQHGLSKAQQGYLFGVLGGPEFAHRWYRGAKSKSLPGHRGPAHSKAYWSKRVNKAASARTHRAVPKKSSGRRR